MEDGDTESENASRVIQDFVFLCRKEVVSMGSFCRYKIKHEHSCKILYLSNVTFNKA